jgi:hypothetical protein
VTVAVVGFSLAAHGAAAVAVFWPRHAPATEQAKGDPAPAFAGETFELPAPETADDPLVNAAASPETTAAPSDTEIADAPAHPAPRSRARLAARASREGRPSGGRAEGAKDGVSGGTGSTPGGYGAVGDRSAQDLRMAFLRAFSLTASANRAWSNAPIGPLGEVTVTITLDDTGHVTDWTIRGMPTPLLRQGLESTMQLVKNRPFTSQGKVTRLHFSAEIREGGGGVFGVDASGSFSLPVGHTVSLTPLK